LLVRSNKDKEKHRNYESIFKSFNDLDEFIDQNLLYTSSLEIDKQLIEVCCYKSTEELKVFLKSKNF